MSQPNILMIFTDQQRFDTIHALNNPIIRTPNLDRLVRQGVAFTSAFTPSPVCVAARASLHWGRYPAHTKCYDNGYANPTSPTFMQILSDAGYRTHGIGKCHFAPDKNSLNGFQSRESQEEAARCDKPNDLYMQYIKDSAMPHVQEPHGSRGEMYYTPQVSLLDEKHHPTNWIGERSLAFIREQADGDQPWMLFSSFIHPHPPFAPPTPWHRLYRAPLMPLPKVPPESESLHLHINRYQNRYKYRDQGIDRNFVRSIKAHYYACISFIDYQVGRLLDELEATGQLDNTLILFSSDHGELLGDYNCFDKRSMHDSCQRIPMLVRYPQRFGAGEICNSPVSLVDIMPTMLEAAGLASTGFSLDGEDLAQIADGSPSRECVFSQFNEKGNGVYVAINDRYKYCYSAPDNREFLFDRIQDPEETRNRAGAPFCTFQISPVLCSKGVFLPFFP